ncbi:MAG: helix-turn-helix transcriptional regulator [Gemmatimonadota bacterium]
MSETEMLPRYLRPREAAARLGLSRSSLWRLSRDPASGFPRPKRISPGAVGYDERELLEYMERQPSGGTMRGREGNGDGDGPDE